MYMMTHYKQIDLMTQNLVQSCSNGGIISLFGVNVFIHNGGFSAGTEPLVCLHHMVCIDLGHLGDLHPIPILWGC